MGATTFITTFGGKTADEAFRKAVDQAQYHYGHAGYTGSIAEKRKFTMVKRDLTMSPTEQANMLLDDPRFSDKWGPAGCLDLDAGLWMFFGWAPE